MEKRLLTIIVLVTMLSVAGCIGNPLSSQTSQVNAYANAYINATKAYLGPNVTLASSNIVQNGSNAVQLTMTIQDTTPISIWSNGSTYTYAVNIKQFDNANDASNFFNSTSFGYTPRAPADSNIYQQVMGHAPKINRYSIQTVSLSLFGESFNIAQQQDEFVIYGTGTAGPK
ncbi:MAG TPA: hypothetical protein VEB88_05110 [Candidatus Acidoferrales bacterium]|nr:hypothetical protein [Candidatus Acidoferrales bacterium]